MKSQPPSGSGAQKKKDLPYNPSQSAFDDYNYTELYQSCLRAGLLVKPTESRERLISLLEGWEDPDLIEEDNVFHSWRLGLINFLNEYWRRIETQVTCPARHLRDPVNPNPRPCFGCIDTQVVTCLVQNRENEPRIAQLRVIRKPNGSTNHD